MGGSVAPVHKCSGHLFMNLLLHALTRINVIGTKIVAKCQVGFLNPATLYSTAASKEFRLQSSVESLLFLKSPNRAMRVPMIRRYGGVREK